MDLRWFDVASRVFVGLLGATLGRLGGRFGRVRGEVQNPETHAGIFEVCPSRDLRGGRRTCEEVGGSPALLHKATVRNSPFGSHGLTRWGRNKGGAYLCKPSNVRCTISRHVQMDGDSEDDIDLVAWTLL